MQRIIVTAALLLCSAVAAFAQGTVVGGPFTPGHTILGGCPGELSPTQLTICVQDGGVASNAINITSPTFGASSTATSAANTTAIQAAINAAIAASVPLYIPSAGAGCYNYTAPLTINGNLTIVGDYVSGNWAGTAQVNVPSGTPPLVGSVLCPTANGSDAVDITGTAVQVNVRNVGILFQTTFGQSSTTTGDGFHYVPTGTNQGLTGGQWSNVMVYGHDGNHYAYNFQNAIYGEYNNLNSFGGGTLNLFGTSASLNYGNAVYVGLYGQTVVGGAANCVSLSASALQRLNLITFVRPQCITNNVAGVSPGGNLPTSAQLIWSEDANVTNIKKITLDLETNVSSPVTFGTAAHGNDFDVAGLFATAASISAPAWLTNGIAYGPQTRTYTDTTSSGTVALAGTYAIPGGPVAASSATTYTQYATLYVGAPAAGTNVTMTSPQAINANGAIFTSSNITSNNGAFFKGTTQINTSNGAATSEIGDGTTSGTVTIGGASNTTNLNSATLTVTNLATDATHTDRTVCQDTTTKSLFFGSGAAGICLGTSSVRYKHDIADIDVGLNELMALKPVQYKLNADHGDPDKILYGFTAEQGGQALPKLVGRDTEDHPNTFDYVGVIPVLVKALQEQQARITALETQLK